MNNLSHSMHLTRRWARRWACADERWSRRQACSGAAAAASERRERGPTSTGRGGGRARERGRARVRPTAPLAAGLDLLVSSPANPTLSSLPPFTSSTRGNDRRTASAFASALLEMMIFTWLMHLLFRRQMEECLSYFKTPCWSRSKYENFDDHVQ
jgi:hypothetical protein